MKLLVIQFKRILISYHDISHFFNEKKKLKFKERIKLIEIGLAPFKSILKVSCMNKKINIE